MNLHLMFDNVLSAALIAVLWWLVHLNARVPEPFGRRISIGYSVLAMCVLFNVLFRNTPELAWALPTSIMISKGALVATLALVGQRLEILHPPKGGL